MLSADWSDGVRWGPIGSRWGPIGSDVVRLGPMGSDVVRLGPMGSDWVISHTVEYCQKISEKVSPIPISILHTKSIADTCANTQKVSPIIFIVHSS